MNVRFGIRIPTYNGDRSAPLWNRVDYKVIRDNALEYERLGFDSIWVADHLIGQDPGDILESWTVLSSLASLTRSIRLGTLVLCNSFRNPSVVAKMSSTLDVVSQGRLELGLGAGGREREFAAYGIPWYNNAVRLNMLREGIIVIKKLWTEKSPSFKGRYYEIKDCICEPKPLQKPHPPIWIGGGGEKLTLKIAAELADGCGFPAPNTSVEDYRRKLAVLRSHCNKLRRDYSEIKKFWGGCVIISENREHVEAMVRQFKSIDQYFSGMSTEEYRKKYIVGSPQECIDRIHEYVDIGVTDFMLWFTDFPSTTQVKLFADEVMTAFRAY